MAGNTINGKDMYSTWGASFQRGAYAEFLTPPSVKSYIENNDRSKDGTQVLPRNPRFEDREVNVNVTLTASTPEKLLEYYNSFVNELTKSGWLVIDIPTLNTTYRMLYVSASKYSLYGSSCSLSIRLREPDPSNRSNE